MVVHRLSFPFASSLPAIYLSTARSSFPSPTCGSVSPAVAPWFTQLPAAKQGEWVSPRHAHRVHPYSNIIIYVNAYKLSNNLNEYQKENSPADGYVYVEKIRPPDLDNLSDVDYYEVGLNSLRLFIRKMLEESNENRN
ncbi:MAG: hypothetical protein QXW39_09225 [Candidatus Bathyarchaeia archaeon]